MSAVKGYVHNQVATQNVKVIISFNPPPPPPLNFGSNQRGRQKKYAKTVFETFTYFFHCV